MSALIDNLEAMLAKGQDNALLRFGLGQAYFNEKNYARAREHLTEATLQDKNNSAAWKILGKTLVELGELDAAITTYQSGIDIAETRGDKQAAKEMQVFLRRILKTQQDK